MKRFVFLATSYAGSAGFLRALGFALTLWVARTLSVDEYAAWGLCYAIQTGIASFSIVGITESVVGLLQPQNGPEERKGLFAAGNGAFGVTATAAVVVSAVIGIFFMRRHNAVGWTLPSVLVSGAVIGYSSLQSQFSRLEERHFRSIGFNFIVPVAGVIGSLGFFLADRSVKSFFLGSAAGLLAGTALMGGGVYGVSFRDQQRRKILQRIWPFVAVACFGWLAGYGSNFIINEFFAPDQVARFTFALTIGSVMNLLASAFNQVWSPRFFVITRSEDMEFVERKNWRFFTLLSMLLGAVGCLTLVLLPPVLGWMGGNLAFYGSMRLELFFVFGAYVCLGPWWHCQNYFIAYDKGINIMNSVVVTGIIGMTVWVLMMKLIGPQGIYAGFCSQAVIRMFGLVLAARKHWTLRIAWAGLFVGMILLTSGFFISAKVWSR